MYLSQRFKLRTILLFDSIESRDVKRLIANNISYISVNSLSLPFLGTVIEKIQQPQLLRKKYTSNQQQLLVLLLLNEDHKIYPKDYVSKLDISIATIYRLLKYFSDLGYIESKHGYYIYLESRKYIYEDSLNSFINPIEREIYLPKNIISAFDNYNINYFKSGLDALSDHSMLETTNTVFGIDNSTLIRFLERYKTHDSFKPKHDQETENAINILTSTIDHNLDSFYRYNKDIKLDIWKYKPLLSQQKILNIVDLSILNIEHNQDPRLQDALHSIEKSLYALLDNLDK